MNFDGLMVFIYIIACEFGNYYVQKTPELISNALNYFSNLEKPWISMYKPLYIEEIVETDKDDDDTFYTLQYMKKFGIPRVRGGKYSEPFFEPDILVELQEEIQNIKEKCTRCYRNGHFRSECFYTTYANGTKLCEEYMI